MDESLKGGEIRKNWLLPIFGSLSRQRILDHDRVLVLCRDRES